MNAELPPFKNGVHNSESASTIDRGLTTLRMKLTKQVYLSASRIFNHMTMNPLNTLSMC